MNKNEKDKPESTSVPPSLKHSDESRPLLNECTETPWYITWPSSWQPDHPRPSPTKTTRDQKSFRTDHQPSFSPDDTCWACVCLYPLQKKPAGTYTPLPPSCSLKPNNHSSLHYVWAEGKHGINMIQYKSSGYEPEQQHPPADSKTKEGGRGV